MARTKDEKVMMKIAGIGQRIFYISLDTLQLYHNMILSPIVGFGAGVWGHRARDKRTKLKLRSSQRKVLLRFTGTYGTIPTLALLVIPGIWPLNL